MPDVRRPREARGNAQHTKLIHFHSDIFAPTFGSKGESRKKIHLLSMILY